MEYPTVSIPKPLDNKVRKLIKNTGFTSVSSFVIYILRELVIENDGKPVMAGQSKIKERLKALGYI
jgi:Arc/MetJ-type ribon-helix-helix transcriptional regulator